MTARTSETVMEAARLWAIRVRDPGFADWDAFTAWLEEAPEHQAAYDDAVDDDEWAGELFTAAPDEITIEQSPPAFSHQPAPRRHMGRFRAGALAASLAAVATVGGWFALDRGDMQEYVTGPGERREISLADGSRVILNGATRIAFDEDRPREVTIAQGEALFEVRHDDHDPFIVLAGDTRLVDIGTVFNVVEQAGSFDIAVAEGAVVYHHAAHEIRLNAGDGLSRAGKDAEPVLRKSAPDTIGAWKSGYLHYVDAPLTQVANDLSRNLGTPVTVSDTVAGRRFSGTLMLDGPHEAVLERTGALVGVALTRRDNRWVMISTNGETR